MLEAVYQRLERNMMDELNQMNPDATSDDFSIDEVNEQTSEDTE